MAFKTFIAVIWLCVPLAAWHFATISYVNYQNAEQQQLSILDEWEAYLRVHARSLSRGSTELRGIVSDTQLREWRSHWQDLLDERESEQARLPRNSADHYPLTQARLFELDKQLDEMQQQAEQAARSSEDVLRLRSSIEQLVMQMDAAQSNAWYYQQIRAWGIHDLLMDDLHNMHDAYEQRQRDLRRAEQQAEAKLAEVSRSERQIMQALSKLDDLKLADGRDSYEQNLTRRLMEFNLPEELRKLAAGDDINAAPGRPGIV